MRNEVVLGLGSYVKAVFERQQLLVLSADIFQGGNNSFLLLPCLVQLREICDEGAELFLSEVCLQEHHASFVNMSGDFQLSKSLFVALNWLRGKFLDERFDILPSSLLQLLVIFALVLSINSNCVETTHNPFVVPYRIDLGNSCFHGWHVVREYVEKIRSVDNLGEQLRVCRCQNSQNLLRVFILKALQKYYIRIYNFQLIFAQQVDRVDSSCVFFQELCEHVFEAKAVVFANLFSLGAVRVGYDVNQLRL